MKTFLMTLFKIIGLLVLIPLIIGSIASFCSGEMIGAIILLIISFFPCFFIIRSFFKKDKNNNEKKSKICPLCEHKLTVLNTSLYGKLKSGEKVCIQCLQKMSEFEPLLASRSKEYTLLQVKEIISQPIQETEQNNFDKEVIATISKIEVTPYKTAGAPKNIRDFDIYSIANRSRQLLESLEIMETSLNPDTVVGRFNFVREVLNDIVIFREHKKFLTGIQKGVDEYRAMYYDRVLPSLYVSFLMNPQEGLLLLLSFYKNCIIKSCLRHFEKQVNQMFQLKQQKAINNRIDKLELILQYSLSELKNQDLKDDESELQIKFDLIKKEFYKPF